MLLQFLLQTESIRFFFGESDYDHYKEYLELNKKQFGLHLIKESYVVEIKMKYSNIIRNYKIFYGSCKKKFKPLLKNDKRWIVIQKQIGQDLKLMGLEKIMNQLISNIKNNEIFMYEEEQNLPFKKYCIET